MGSKQTGSAYLYIGCFFAEEQWEQILARIPGDRLAQGAAHPHVTLCYRPETVDESLFGERIRVRVTGYGCDGKNEGLRVELSAENQILRGMIREIPVPHITVSTAEGAEARDTKDLAFEPLEPWEMEGIFGGVHLSGRLILTRRDLPDAFAPGDTIEAAHNRYVVPFFWDTGRISYPEAVRHLREEALAQKWKCRGIRRGEQDLYDYILDSMEEDSEDLSNIGSAWNVNKEQILRMNLPSLRFVSVWGEEYPVKVSDMGIYLFRTGIGLFWYDMRNEIREVSEWMRFQNAAKELSAKIYDTREDARKKKRSYFVREGVPEGVTGFEEICLGEWVRRQVREAIPGAAFFAERRAARKKTGTPVPDKAILYQYVLIRPAEQVPPKVLESHLEEIAFCLTGGENGDNVSGHLPSIRPEMYYPFDGRFFYASRGGCGHYVLSKTGNEDFLRRGLPERWITNYFPLYMILLHQTYSLLYFTEQMERLLPASMEPYREGEERILELLDRFRLRFNTFLIKDIYASVAHLENYDRFYRYVQKQLRIEEDIRGLQLGLETVAEMEHLIRERQEQAAKEQREKRRREKEEAERAEREREEQRRQQREEAEKAAGRRTDRLLALLSFLALASILQDGSTVIDRLLGTETASMTGWHWLFSGVVILGILAILVWNYFREKPPKDM